MIDVVAVTAIAGFTLSSLAGTIRRGIDERRQAKERRIRGPEAVCGCKHHLSFHDMTTGQCHGQTQLKVKDANGETVGKRASSAPAAATSARSRSAGTSCRR